MLQILPIQNKLVRSLLALERGVEAIKENCSGNKMIVATVVRRVGEEQNGIRGDVLRDEAESVEPAACDHRAAEVMLQRILAFRAEPASQLFRAEAPTGAPAIQPRPQDDGRRCIWHFPAEHLDDGGQSGAKMLVWDVCEPSQSFSYCGYGIAIHLGSLDDAREYRLHSAPARSIT